MSISTHFCDPHLWAQTHFGCTVLGDARRSRRVVTLATGWARQPGATIPQLSAGLAGTSKAAYRLLGSAAATPAALQAPHQALVQQAVLAAGTWLLMEDTTELRWPETDERRPGLGPGRATSQGGAIALADGCQLAGAGP